MQTRLNERDEKIQYLEKELDEEQLRHDQIGGQITALKERFGIASAQAEKLTRSITTSARKCTLEKQQEQQKTQEKIDRTFTRINGVENYPFRKRKAFCRTATAY